MDGKKLKERKVRFAKLYKKLAELFPHRKTMLNYSNPWELVVAVTLSAQCTDKQVNKVTEKLFKKYPTLDHYLKARRTEFERDIFSTGFYRAKAKNVLSAAKVLRTEFDDVVPKTIDELTRLPGVGRKTANVVLKNAFNINEGVAVDTHVIRFAKRYDLSDYETAVKIERDLMQIIPQKDWGRAAYLIISYGRTLGPARNWEREVDPLVEIYKKAKDN